MENKKQVLIIYSIDSEGPLYESLQAKFDLLKELYGINDITPNELNLQKLQKGEIDLEGREEEVMSFLSSHRINYNDSWDKINLMLERIMESEFRNKLLDSYGNGWIYNWACLDHVGYENNPRHRDIGYHNIFDHYREIIKNTPNCPDEVHWHFHPMSTYRDAHYCATSYVNSPELYQVLSRRIIEREWFPSVFRAGFHVERPDSHLFLEQWIPFDLSNISLDDNSELENSASFKNGRTGDWRLAPSDWSIYHPSHDYYQLPGNCRRWIARFLFLLNRVANFDQRESDKAFARAQEGKPTLLGIGSHDFRDLGPEIDYARERIQESAKKFPEVKFKFCEAIEGFQRAIWPGGIEGDPLELEVIFHPKEGREEPFIEVLTKKGKVFGPQPFLAIQTRSRRFIHDNFDFTVSLDRWLYPFYTNTLQLEDVSRIGVAANDQYGNTCVKVIEF